MIDFVSAEWCYACKTVYPSIEKISNKTGIKINFINYDELDEPEKDKYKSLPTIIYNNVTYTSKELPSLELSLCENDFQYLNDPDRFSLYPIKHNDIYQLYKKQLSSFWIVEEVDLSKDKTHFEKLSQPEMNLIKHVLAFFSVADHFVNINIMQDFINQIQCPEIISCYSVQSMIETIHAEMYSLLVQTYFNDDEEKSKLFNSLEHYPVIKKKIQFLEKYKSYSYPYKLLAYLCMEAIMFASCFCVIYYFKSKNILPGLTLSNEFIARDESYHALFACTIYNKLIKSRLPQEEVYKIFSEAVEIESEFFKSALGHTSFNEINHDDMVEYIKFISDKWLNQIGYSNMYNAKQPFNFMNLINLNIKGNFFETRISSYQKVHLDTIDLNSDDDF
jgi:ribonucleoside-diphosphate reductase beta chain